MLKKFSRLFFTFLFLFETISCGDVNNTILEKFNQQSTHQGFKVDNMLPLDWLACKGYGIYSNQEFQNLQARRDEIDKRELTRNEEYKKKNLLLETEFDCLKRRYEDREVALKQKEAQLDTDFKNKTEQFAIQFDKVTDLEIALQKERKTHEAVLLKLQSSEANFAATNKDLIAKQASLPELEQELEKKATIIKSLENRLENNLKKIESLKLENLDLECKAGSAQVLITQQNSDLEKLKIDLASRDEALEKTVNDRAAIEGKLNELAAKEKDYKGQLTDEEKNIAMRAREALFKELRFDLECAEQGREKSVKDRLEIEGKLNQVSEELKEKKQLDLKNCNDVEATIKKNFEEQIPSLKTQLSEVKTKALENVKAQDTYIKNLAKLQPKDLSQAPLSRLRSFVLPIGFFLTALLGMGAGVAFSDAIKNVLAVLLKRA